MTPIITDVETKYAGWARFLLAQVRLPDGNIIRREIEDHGAAVAVLPYDPERKTAILVQQLRAPVLFSSGQPHTLEVVAGIREDIDAAATARREAMEEAGLALQSLEHVATAWAMPGISTEQMTLYLATYRLTDRTGDGGGLSHEHENITVVEMPVSALVAVMRSGDLVDMKTLVLTQALQLRRPDLFA